MTITRLPTPPRSIALTAGARTLYAIELSPAPSRAWRTAFLRPPARLRTAAATPALGGLELAGARVLFRTTPSRLHYWLRWIDRWVEHANSVVAK
jgi:hypothetical protein